MQSRLKPSIFSVTSQARFNFGVESVVVFCKYLVYRVLGWIGCHIPSAFIFFSTMLLNFSNLLFIYNWCNIIHNLRYFLFILLSYWFFCFYTVSIPFFWCNIIIHNLWYFYLYYYPTDFSAFTQLVFLFWCNIIIHNLGYILFILLSYWFFCFYTVIVSLFLLSPVLMGL